MMMPNAPDRERHQDGGRALVSLREASLRWARLERSRPRCTSGVGPLDVALGGGWPHGRVCELLGVRSCGRTGVAVATVAAATARGEVVVWLDGEDAFDPASAAAAGVDLSRALWVRPRTPGEAVRAAELVLEAGGFTVLVLDLGELRGAARDDAEPAERGDRRRGPLRLRLARAVERAGAVALVLSGRPWAGASAAVTVQLAAARPLWVAGVTGRETDERRGQWSVVGGQPVDHATRVGDGSGGGGAVPGPRSPVLGPREGGRVWLAGLELSFQLQRGGARAPAPAARVEGF